MSDRSDKMPFWSTLPGILTGIAAVLGTICTLLVFMQPDPIIISFDANPSEITVGNSTEFNWNVKNADEVYLNNERVDLIGHKDKILSSTTNYTLKAIKSYFFWKAKEVHLSHIITVNPKKKINKPDIKYFVADPTSIAPGESSTVSWNIINANTVLIDQFGAVGSSGVKEVYPSETTNYNLETANEAGTVERTITVTVETRQEAPKTILPVGDQERNVRTINASNDDGIAKIPEEQIHSSESANLESKRPIGKTPDGYIDPQGKTLSRIDYINKYKIDPEIYFSEREASNSTAADLESQRPIGKTPDGYIDPQGKTLSRVDYINKYKIDPEIYFSEREASNSTAANLESQRPIGKTPDGYIDPQGKTLSRIDYINKYKIDPEIYFSEREVSNSTAANQESQRPIGKTPDGYIDPQGKTLSRIDYINKYKIDPEIYFK
jgi:hypothetical protein